MKLLILFLMVLQAAHGVTTASSPSAYCPQPVAVGSGSATGGIGEVECFELQSDALERATSNCLLNLPSCFETPGCVPGRTGWGFEQVSECTANGGLTTILATAKILCNVRCVPE